MAGDLKETGVQLVAKDADKFTRDLQSGQKAIAGLGNQAKKSAGDLSALQSPMESLARGDLKGGISGIVAALGPLGGIAIAAAAGVGVLLGAYNKLIEAGRALIKEQDDLADKFGLTMREAGALSNFAKIMGVDIGAVTLALKTMATHGIPPTLDGLREVKARLDDIDDPAKRTAETVKLLGRSGLELSETLGLSNDEFDRLIGLAQKAALLTDNAAEAQDAYNRELNVYRVTAANANAIATAHGLTTKNNISLWWEEFRATGQVGLAIESMTGQVFESNAGFEVLTAGLNAMIEAERVGIDLSFEQARGWAADADRLTALAVAAGEIPHRLGEIAPAAEEAAGATKTSFQDVPSVWDTVFPDPAELAGKIADQAAFIKAGGPQIVAAIQELQAGLAEGILTPEQALPMLDELQEAALSIAVDAGDTTAWDAAKQNAEDFGGPIGQAKLDIADAAKTIKTIPREITIRISFLAPHLPGAGFQHGGSFTVGGRAGPDANLVAFRATRGERVMISPAGTTNNVTNNGSPKTVIFQPTIERDVDGMALLEQMTQAVQRI